MATYCKKCEHWSWGGMHTPNSCDREFNAAEKNPFTGEAITDPQYHDFKANRDGNCQYYQKRDMGLFAIMGRFFG